MLRCLLLPNGLGERTESERFDNYSLSVAGKQVRNVCERSLIKAFDELPLSNCTWVLTVALEGQDSPHSFRNDNRKEWSQVFSELKLGWEVSQEATVRFNVLRNLPSESLHIISPTTLFSWVNKLEMPTLLDELKRACPSATTVWLLHPTFTTDCGSSLLRLATSQTHGAAKIKDRAKLVQARRELIVSDWSDLNFFAQDFRWDDSLAEHPLKECFSRLENFITAISLADCSFAKEVKGRPGFLIRVRGHRMREQALRWEDIPVKPDVSLRGVDDWCYHTGGAGPLSDKLGLARNFISLHWESEKKGIYGLDHRLVQAVRSGYELYLKRNLKEYVDLRGKVITTILEIDGKASKALETSASNLEKNFYGIVTYASSAVLVKAITDKQLGGVLTPSVAVLGLMLAAISLLHARFAWSTTMNELTRAKEIYDDVRKQYSEFFEPQHFDSIFGTNDQSPMTKVELYVKQRMTKLMGVWIATLVILCVVIVWMTNWK